MSQKLRVGSFEYHNEKGMILYIKKILIGIQIIKTNTISLVMIKPFTSLGMMISILFNPNYV